MNTYGIEQLGIINTKAVYRNLTIAQLTEQALAHNEGMLSETGAFVIYTGKYTGRSPNDRFVVDDDVSHDTVDWGKVNVPVSTEVFDKIYTKTIAYLQGRDIFIFDGYAGADPDFRLSLRIINSHASQNLFIHQLLIRPESDAELEGFAPGFTIIAVPDLRLIPEEDKVRSECAVVVNFKKKIVLVCGTAYAGEIKKSVFSVMNYILPAQGVFPMHCSANIGDNDDVALFFGLSGTGKTTLSADPNRRLIGDDEHGWSKNGTFNFEGGCYAKCINLSQEHEPQIWNAIRFGALIENVVMDPETRKLDFDDGSVTENTRAGYPIDFIPNAQIPGIAGHPKAVIFLTADAFGVLPPISKLTREQAMYHFISGYTSKLAGTERGIVEPEATFSTCFGAPFLPRHPMVYANLLADRIDTYGSSVYLINTGWSGGAYGVGKRMSIKNTRAMVTAALNGELEKSEFALDPIFNVLVPTFCPGVSSEVLNPVNTWADKEDYAATAKKLAAMFQKNFAKYSHMPAEVVNAGPKA